MKIYCTGCEKEVEARLTNGEEMYPHRPDLYSMPFWKCDWCRAFVGTHNKTNNPTSPLGFLATPEVKRWRKAIYSKLDPLWESGKISRKKAYQHISNKLGKTYHTAEIYSADEGKLIYRIVKELQESLEGNQRLTI